MQLEELKKNKMLENEGQAEYDPAKSLNDNMDYDTGVESNRNTMNAVTDQIVTSQKKKKNSIDFKKYKASLTNKF